MPRLHASFSREMSATSLGRDRGSRKHSNYNSMNKWSAKMFICFCLFHFSDNKEIFKVSLYQMRKPRGVNKAVNRTQQKIWQLGIPQVVVEFLHEAILVCLTG